MLINLDSTRRSKETLKTFLENKQRDPNFLRKSAITEFAVGYSCPLVVINFYVAEMQGGFDDELIRNINSLVKFYGYTEVSGLEIELPESIGLKKVEREQKV